MLDIFHAAFSWPNLPATILLLLVGMYWVVFLIGLVDFSTFDISIDTDVDIDADIDVETEVDLDADGSVDGPGAFARVLGFFNLGSVPLTVWLSFFALLFWAASMMMNHYLTDLSLIAGYALLIPIALVLAFINKFLTWPFKKLFKALNEFAKPVEMIGKICKVTLSVDGDSTGQAEVFVDGDYFKIRVKTEEKAIASGEQAVIYQHEKDTDIYFIEPFNPQ